MLELRIILVKDREEDMDESKQQVRKKFSQVCMFVLPLAIERHLSPAVSNL